MTRPLEFRPMLAADALLLEVQTSQHFELGLHAPKLTYDDGEDLAENGVAWTAHRGSRIVACAGFRELYRGHAVVWAALGAELGADHLAVTRFAREQVAAVPFRRLEAIVEAANERAVTWATMVGLTAVHILRGYGAEGADHILFER